MENNQLSTIYFKIFDEQYEPHKSKLAQNTFFLLDRLMELDKYDFRLYKSGAYSSRLQDDLNSADWTITNVKLDKELELCVQKLRESIMSSLKMSRTIEEWTELLATIQYVREYVVYSTIKGSWDAKEVKRITNSMPHKFSKHGINFIAFHELLALFCYRYYKNYGWSEF